MALTVGTRVRVTLSGEVPPPTTDNGFGGFNSGNATRNKIGKLTMFAKSFIILDNKFFIPMTSVIQIEVLPPDQQQTQQGFSFGGNTTGNNPFGTTAVQNVEQPISIQFSHPKYM